MEDVKDEVSLPRLKLPLGVIEVVVLGAGHWVSLSNTHCGGIFVPLEEVQLMNLKPTVRVKHILGKHNLVI